MASLAVSLRRPPAMGLAGASRPGTAAGGAAQSVRTPHRAIQLPRGPPCGGSSPATPCKATAGLGAWLSAAVGGGKSSQVRKLKEDLLEAVSGTKFGAKCSRAKREEVEELVQQLEGISGGDTSPTRGKLSGGWSLVYTTEVHFIVNGFLLGLSVQNISQTIDLRELRVTNAIYFALGVGLRVGAPATVEGPRRIAYEFDSAALTVAGKKLKFSPQGKGWTEAVFCDDSFRVMRNSRGDTLIFSKEQ